MRRRALLVGSGTARAAEEARNVSRELTTARGRSTSPRQPGQLLWRRTWPTSRSWCCRRHPTDGIWPHDSRHGCNGRCTRWRCPCRPRASTSFATAARSCTRSAPTAAFVATLQPGVRGVGRRRRRRQRSTRHARRRRPTGRNGRSRCFRPTRPPSTSPKPTESLPEVPVSTHPARFDQLAVLGAALRRQRRGHSGRHRSWLGRPRASDRHDRRHRRPALYIAFGISGAVQHTSGLGRRRPTSSASTPTRTVR